MNDRNLNDDPVWAEEIDQRLSTSGAVLIAVSAVCVVGFLFALTLAVMS